MVQLKDHCSVIELSWAVQLTLLVIELTCHDTDDCETACEW